MSDMHVYFDSTGEIKSISPHSMADCEGLSVAIVPVVDVEDFLTGKKSTFNYLVVLKGSVVEFARKQVIELSLVRTLDNYLVRADKELPSTLCFIKNNVSSNTIVITVNRELINTCNDVDRQTVMCNFFNTSRAPLFFTHKDDPHILLHTIYFSPVELYAQSKLMVPYTGKLINVGVYTYAAQIEYSYKED